MTGERFTPNQEAAKLIKTKDETERQQITVLAEEIRSKRLFNPADEVDKRTVPAKARALIRNFSGTETVEELYNITQDEQKTERQQEQSKENIEKLGKAVFLVMYYGGNEEMAKRVLGGSESVEEVLPAPFKGLGDAVVNNLIKSEEVRGILEEVDMVKTRVDFENPVEIEYLNEELNEAIKRIVRVKVDRVFNNEVIMAKNYLVSLREKYKTEEPRREEREKAQVDFDPNLIALAVAKGVGDAIKGSEGSEAEKENESTRQRYDFFYAMLTHEAPQDSNPFSTMSPEWMAKHPDKALLQKVIQLGNAAHYKLRYGNADLNVLLDTRGEGTFSASNEIMRKLYEEVPGVKESLESIVGEFFVPAEEHGKYVLRLKVQGNNDEERSKYIQKKFGDVSKLQLGCVADLVGKDKLFYSGDSENDEFKDKTEALQAVVIAWNIIYVGNTFECADINNWIPAGETSVAQAWNLMHPDAKARSKILKFDKDEQGVRRPDTLGTEEGWGGAKGQWFVKQFERFRSGEKDAAEFVRNYDAGLIHPFPERMFASLLTLTKVWVPRKGEESKSKEEDIEYEEMSFAQALMEKKRINFINENRGGNMWGAYYDVGDSARKLYEATTGKMSLPLGSDKWSEVRNWVAVVVDARNKLRKTPLLRPYIDNREFVLWAIAGATNGGLFLDSTKLVLLTPDVLGPQHIDFEILFQTRDLVSKEDAEWISRQFHAWGRGSDRERKRIMGLFPF
jgi:hypothetical protein